MTGLDLTSTVEIIPWLGPDLTSTTEILPWLRIDLASTAERDHTMGWTRPDKNSRYLTRPGLDLTRTVENIPWLGLDLTRTVYILPGHD